VPNMGRIEEFALDTEESSPEEIRTGRETHLYELPLELNNVESRKVRAGCPWTTVFVKGFTHWVSEEFFESQFHRGFFEAIEGLYRA
jgi:hypothetical protein